MSRCCLCKRGIPLGAEYHTPGLFHFTDKVLGTSMLYLIWGDCCERCAKIISRFYWTIEHVNTRLQRRG